MSAGPALLLALALSTPSTSGPSAPGAPKAPPGEVACTRYRVLAEKNDLAPEQEVAAWGRAALDRSALLDEGSPCFVHVRITAGPIRAGGRQDGWVAHVAVSTRRYVKDGKHVTREKGMLFVEPEREALVARARGFVEEFVARLAGGAADAPGGERR